MMRILHVIASLTERHGGPSNLPKLAAALAQRGCKVSIFTTDTDERGSMWPWHRTRRLAADKQSASEGQVRIRYFPVNWPSRYACSWQMAHALRDSISAFDVVHIHSLYLFTSTVAAHYCRAYGVPYIIRPHGTLDPWHRRQRWWIKLPYHWLIEDRNIGHAAGIHYTSAAEARFARQIGITAREFIIRQGIALDEFKELPPRGGFRSGHRTLARKHLIVFLGRITPKKGFDILIPALRQLVASDSRVHLVIAGPDDEGYGATVRRWVHESGLDEHVTWTGMLVGQEKIQLLRDADVWVLPSHDENFGIAAVEAMAAGAPIILTNRVGVHNAVSEANAGLVIVPEAGALADAMRRVLTHTNLREELRQHGRTLAMEAFVWDTIVGEVIDMYRAVLADHCLG